MSTKLDRAELQKIAMRLVNGAAIIEQAIASPDEPVFVRFLYERNWKHTPHPEWRFTECDYCVGAPPGFTLKKQAGGFELVKIADLHHSKESGEVIWATNTASSIYSLAIHKVGIAIGIATPSMRTPVVVLQPGRMIDMHIGTAIFDLVPKMYSSPCPKLAGPPVEIKMCYDLLLPCPVSWDDTLNSTMGADRVSNKEIER